jgi:hypothetical protein
MRRTTMRPLPRRPRRLAPSMRAGPRTFSSTAAAAWCWATLAWRWTSTKTGPCRASAPRSTWRPRRVWAWEANACGGRAARALCCRAVPQPPAARRWGTHAPPLCAAARPSAHTRPAPTLPTRPPARPPRRPQVISLPTAREVAAGTPRAARARPYGTAVDVWAVGVLAYEMLTHRAPFAHRRPEFATLLTQAGARAPLPPGASPEVAAFVAAALALQPGARPAAADLLAHPWIIKHCGGAPATAARPGPRLPLVLPPPPPGPCPDLAPACPVALEAAHAVLGLQGAAAGSGACGCAAGALFAPAPPPLPLPSVLPSDAQAQAALMPSPSSQQALPLAAPPAVLALSQGLVPAAGALPPPACPLVQRRSSLPLMSARSCAADSGDAPPGLGPLRADSCGLCGQDLPAAAARLARAARPRAAA